MVVHIQYYIMLAWDHLYVFTLAAHRKAIIMSWEKWLTSRSTVTQDKHKSSATPKHKQETSFSVLQIFKNPIILEFAECRGKPFVPHSVTLAD